LGPESLEQSAIQREHTVKSRWLGELSRDSCVCWAHWGGQVRGSSQERGETGVQKEHAGGSGCARALGCLGGAGAHALCALER
jgi:hypothetical protein